MGQHPADEAHLRQHLETLDALPTLPVIALEGMKRALQPAGSIQDLAVIAELDPPMAARILRAANASAFGRPGNVTSLHEALATIGYAGLRDIVLSASALEIFAERKQEYGLDVQGLWMHSIGTAVWARRLTGLADPALDPEEAFLAGLLHDIGKVALCTHLRSRYREIVRRARERGEPLHRVERERLGYDHADVGQWVLEHWALPAVFRDTVQQHHAVTGTFPRSPHHVHLCRIVHLANRLAHCFGPPPDDESVREEMPVERLEEASIPLERVRALRDEWEGEVGQRLARLDWRPVSLADYFPVLAEANLALGDLRQAHVTRERTLARRERELEGINQLGLRLQGCSTLQEALRTVTETLVTAFPFGQAVSAFYLDDGWELCAQARKEGGADPCRSLVVEQKRLPEPREQDPSSGPWLFVHLIGKEAPLGYLRVQADPDDPPTLDKVGLLLASCAKLTAEAVERIHSHQRVRTLTTDLERSLSQLEEERRRVEGERLQKERILENIPLGILLLDAQGRILYANAAALRLLPGNSLRAGEPLATVLRDTSFASDRAALSAGRPLARSELLLPLGPDGSERALRRTLVPVDDAAAQAGSLLYILEDVHEERILQRQLLESARMASVGELAAGTAHNLRSPLGAVKGILELLAEEFDSGQIQTYQADGPTPHPTNTVREQIQIVLKSLDKSFTIIDDLLQFARKPDRPPESLLLRELLDGTEALLGELFRERGIMIERRIEAERVFGRKADLVQVFLNMYSNAYKAMPNGGTLTIESQPVPGVSAVASHIRVTVADTGCGISPENLPKIFDPFYTTSDRVEGTGLGLSLTHKMVREHGGSLEAASRIGEGTTFTLFLPATPEAFLSRTAGPG